MTLIVSVDTLCRATALRQRVDEHNQSHALGRDVQRVTTYRACSAGSTGRIQTESAEKGERNMTNRAWTKARGARWLALAFVAYGCNT